MNKSVVGDLQQVCVTISKVDGPALGGIEPDKYLQGICGTMAKVLAPVKGRTKPTTGGKKCGRTRTGSMASITADLSKVPQVRQSGSCGGISLRMPKTVLCKFSISTNGDGARRKVVKPKPFCII